MSWVLWDIILPLLLAFGFGLTLGWMLWRWRRRPATVYDAVAATEISSSDIDPSDASQEKMESINALLIAERDEAVERAEAAEGSLAEAQVEILRLTPDLTAADTSTDGFASGAGVNQVVEVSDADIDGSEKYQNLVALLAKEQEQRKNVELELTESNSRCNLLEREHVQAAEAASEVNANRLATLHEDLALSRNVVEEKEQRYLDTVAEMDMVIKAREDKIEQLESQLEFQLDSQIDEQAERQFDASADGTAELLKIDVTEPEDRSSVAARLSTDEDSAVGVKDVDVNAAIVSNAKDGDEKDSDAKDRSAINSDANDSGVKDSAAKADNLKEPDTEGADNSPAEPIALVSPHRSKIDSRGASRSLSAGSSDAAVALADDYVVDTGEEVKPVSLQSPDEDMSTAEESRTHHQDGMSSVNVQGTAANEDSVPGTMEEVSSTNGQTEMGAEQVDATGEIASQIEHPPEPTEKLDGQKEPDSKTQGPDLEHPYAEAPGINGPDTKASDTKAPDTNEPSVNNSGTNSVDTDNLDTNTTDTSTSDTSTSDTNSFDTNRSSAVVDSENEADQEIVTAELEKRPASKSGKKSPLSNKSESSVSKKKSASEKSAAPGTKEKASGKKKKPQKAAANGYRPTAWEVTSRAAGEKNSDKLTDIKGVGPVLERMLHDAGIYYFKQVALLDKDGINELQEQLPQFPGRIKRDKWVSQAKSLHRKKYGTAAKNS